MPVFGRPVKLIDKTINMTENRSIGQINGDSAEKLKMCLNLEVTLSGFRR